MTHKTEQFTSAGKRITMEVHVPSTSGRHPGVLVLHGLSGLTAAWRGDIVSFVEAVAARGMVAMLPHYFDVDAGAGAPLPVTAEVDRLARWHATCEDACRFLGRHPRVDAGSLGAIGFSLGGHIALSLGIAPPVGTTLKCVVDFFGPIVVPALAGDRSKLPPVQIHHGTADPTVPISDSELLVTELRAVGKTPGVGYEMIRYSGEGHGFSGVALTDARASAVSYLSRHL